MAALLACAQLLALAQGQVWPLQGQGVPPAGTTPVQVDVLVETLRSINSNSNSWNGVHWIHLSWNDSRAAPALQVATERWTNGTAACARPCDNSNQPGAGCCDGVWLPHVDATNIVAIPQEAVNRYRVWIDPVTTTVASANGTNTTVTVGGSTVHWVARVTAEWQSPFDFRAWPFEHQHLLLELQVTPSLANRAYLVMGQALFVTNSPHTKGDEVPGWYVAKVTRKLYNTTACWTGTAMGTSTSVYSVSSDAQTVTMKPLNAASWAQLQAANSSSITSITQVSSTLCNPKINVEATAQYAPQILVIDVMVRRTQIYYVLSTVLPLLLLDYMVFITYAMERSDLEARMGVVVALVLAISALQFTYSFPPSSYLNAVQQITLCSYCLYFIVAVESMITSQICRLHARKRSWQSLVTTANGGGLAHAPSGTLGGMSRLNSSAIGMVGPSSSNLVMVDSDGGMAKANGLTVATAGGAALGARTLKRQTSSMRSDRDTTPSSAMGSQHQQQQQGVRHTITEETSLDVTAPDALAPPQQYSPRASSHGGGAHVTSSSSGAHAHVQLEVVELGGGAKQQQRTSVGPMFARAGPAGEASEQQPSSADEGLPPCPPPASASRGLRHRAGAWARKGRGRCIPCSGESTQDDDGVVAPPGALEPCETLGPAATGKRARRRSSLDGIPQALTRAGSTVAMKSREIRGRIDADEAYAQLFAARLDQIFSWTLLVCFTVVVAVLLYINQQVGDHKLMLTGDPPANM